MKANGKVHMVVCMLVERVWAEILAVSNTSFTHAYNADAIGDPPKNKAKNKKTWK